VWKGKEMSETAQQVTENQNVKARIIVVLHAECDPSLKCGFAAKFHSAGFASEADAIRTLARDFIMGRIQYTGGMLLSQEENGQSQQNSQPGHRDEQQGVPRAPGTASEKNKGGCGGE